MPRRPERPFRVGWTSVRVAVAIVLERADWRVIGYAVLSHRGPDAAVALALRRGTTAHGKIRLLYLLGPRLRRVRGRPRSPRTPSSSRGIRPPSAGRRAQRRGTGSGTRQDALGPPEVASRGPGRGRFAGPMKAPARSTRS